MDTLNKKRRNLYKTLKDLGYKIPKNWFNLSIEQLREDIFRFLNNNYTSIILINDTLREMGAYNDEEFRNVIFRLEKGDRLK